jgi:hypothetical protein
MNITCNSDDNRNIWMCFSQVAKYFWSDTHCLNSPELGVFVDFSHFYCIREKCLVGMSYGAIPVAGTLESATE